MTEGTQKSQFKKLEIALKGNSDSFLQQALESYSAYMTDNEYPFTNLAYQATELLMYEFYLHMHPYLRKNLQKREVIPILEGLSEEKKDNTFGISNREVNQ